MNSKALYLIYLLLIINSVSLTSQDNLISLEEFSVTVSGNYFQADKRKIGNCIGIQISNQNGTHLFHHLVSKENVGNDLDIKLKKKSTDELLITFFVKGANGLIDGYTYVNIENGSIINSHIYNYSWSDPYQDEPKLKQISLKLTNAKNIESINVFNPYRYNRIPFEQNQKEVISNFKKSSSSNVFCLITKNGRRYKYFLTEDNPSSYLSDTIYISKKYSDLKKCNIHTMHFPSISHWSGNIRAWIKGSKKPVTIFSKSRDRMNICEKWRFFIPQEEIDSTHIEINKGDYDVNTINNGLPSELDLPSIEIYPHNQEDIKTTLSFTSSKNVGFYVVTYLFNEKIRHFYQMENNLMFVSKWRFIGVENYADFKIPEIHKDFFNTYRDFEYFKNPNFVKITGYHTEFTNPKDFWNTPHILLNKQWQMKNSTFGYKESINLTPYKY